MVNGTLSPVDLDFGSDLLLGANSNTLLTIARIDQYSKVAVSEHFVMDGTLTLQLVGGYVPLHGDSFNFFDWGIQSGSFENIILPLLSTGQNWNIDDLYDAGTITVIPEPSSVTFLMLGLGLAFSGMLFRKYSVNPNRDFRNFNLLRQLS